MKTRAVVSPRVRGSLAGHGADEIRRADAEIAAGGGEQFAGELVVGLVGGQAVVDPLVVDGHRLGPDADGVLALDAEQVAPLERPEIVEFVAGEEAVDELGAVGLRQERARFGGGGQDADHVEVDAAQEGLVGGQGGGRHAHGFQFVVDEFVDAVVGGEFGEGLRPGLRDGQAQDRGLALVGYDDGRIARVFGAHLAFGADAGDLRVGRVVAGVGCHVAHLAVGEDGGDEQPLGLRLLELALVGVELQVGDLGVFLAGPGRAGVQPGRAGCPIRGLRLWCRGGRVLRSP